MTTAKPIPAPNCTCGLCIDGWFSPRMKDRLESEADFLQYASLSLAEDLVTDPDILEGGVLTELFIGADTSLHYIPMDLHPMMTPAFYHGYISIIQSVFRILLRDPTGKLSSVPTIEAVQEYLADIEKAATEETQDANAENEVSEEDKKAEAIKKEKAVIQNELIHAYLDAGGKIEYALDAITDNAFEKSPEGSLYRRDKAIQEEEAEVEKENASLPRCENDLAFELVRSKLGLSMEKRGPYWFFLTDMSSDSEDDEEEGEENKAVYEGAGQDETETKDDSEKKED